MVRIFLFFFYLIFVWKSLFEILFELPPFSDSIVWLFFLGNKAKSTEIDNGISQAIRNSDRISMTKKIFDGRVETTVSAEKMSIGLIWKTFGRTMGTSISNLATLLWKNPTCRKIVYYISTKPINLKRTIRRSTIATIIYWDRLISAKTL